VSQRPGIIELLTLECCEITRLVSEGLDRQLPLAQRLAVKVHMLYCTACRRYRGQLRALGEAIRRLSQALDDEQLAALPHLSPQARERIQRAISGR
jgi:hypothetical protein